MAKRVGHDEHVDAEADGVHALMRRGKLDEPQDALYVAAGVVAVADGMVDRHGVAASKIALDALAATIDEGGGWSSRAPGTTLVAARLDGEIVRGLWSGDSRAYRLRNEGLLELLSEDHSGFMGASERALGGFSPDALHLDQFSCDVADTAGLLLCTDGHGRSTGDPALRAALDGGLITTGGAAVIRSSTHDAQTTELQPRRRYPPFVGLRSHCGPWPDESLRGRSRPRPSTSADGEFGPSHRKDRRELGRFTETGRCGGYHVVDVAARRAARWRRSSARRCP